MCQIATFANFAKCHGRPSKQCLCELQLPAAGWKQVDDAALLQLNLLQCSDRVVGDCKGQQMTMVNDHGESW